MLDADLAALYGVETRVLMQAVKRNPERFPKDFMMQMTNHELAIWRSRAVMSNMAGGNNAASAGLVASLARPGGTKFEPG